MLLMWLSAAFASVGEYSWRLAGVYDGTSIAQLGEAESDFVWIPREGMVESCGPAKSPDGLGVFEAEAVASRLMPTLMIVLERNGGVDLGPESVRVSLGRDGPEVMLQPMVEPRYLEIAVKGEEGAERVVQLVRTQLETETCMEHKTGRAWTGHDTARIRQAFLLDPPPGADRSRKFFGGELDPVPGLIGPPDACIRADGEPPRAATTGRGEGSLTLVPTDVWGASNRRCAANETAGMALGERSRWLQLRSGLEEGVYRDPPRLWTALEIDISLDGPGQDEEERARVDVSWNGEVLFADEALFTPTDTVPGLIDVLARVPYRYPTVSTADRPGQFTVLIIPDWQIVEALRRLEAGHPDQAMRTPPPTVADGVAQVLEHPELLYVQLAAESPDAESWPNLSANLQSSFYAQPWGYTVGELHGRTPIITAGTEPPTWDQSLRAQRGHVQAGVLASGSILFVVLILGIRRFPDLLNPLPEERAHYWPGLEDAAVVDTPANMASDEVEE